MTFFTKNVLVFKLTNCQHFGIKINYLVFKRYNYVYYVYFNYF